MSHSLLLGLAAIIVLGMGAQWLAWRLKLPSILVLLVFGFLAGPVLGFLHPDALLGDLLIPFVSFSVAIILFEGGLSLRIRELSSIGRGLGTLVTLGVLTAWILGSLAAALILGLDPMLSALLGAILVVTGPTVILPLVRHVRPRGRVGPLIKWEGILNDPIGVMLSVLVFEVILAGGWENGSSTALLGLVKTLIPGAAIGLAGAVVVVLLIRFHRLPDFLQSPFVLMAVVAVYTASDLVMEESGLLSVTLMGIALANQRYVVIKHIIEFKENLRVLLLSFLFILLAARLEPASLRVLNPRSVVFLLVLIAVVRPAAVFLSTFGTGLTWREKVFLSWMAPRGIVAAATAPLLAYPLVGMGYRGADILVPQVFLVIVGTVALYGLTAAPLARRLGVAGGRREGCLVVGAHSWARSIAGALQRNGVPVLLVDSNRANLAAARLEGIPVHQANVLAESLPEELPMDDLGRFLALTANEEVNSLAALHFSEVLGRDEVYQLPMEEDDGEEAQDESLSRHLRGRMLFGADQTYRTLNRRFEAGAVVKSTKLSETFDYEAFRERYGDSARLLFVVDGGALKISVAGEKLSPRPGQAVIALVDEPPEEPGRKRDRDRKAGTSPAPPAASPGA